MEITFINSVTALIRNFVVVIVLCELLSEAWQMGMFPEMSVEPGCLVFPTRARG